MKQLFTRTPVPEYAEYSSVHVGAGERYHRRFAEQPGRALMWELERAALERIVAQTAPASILDFACGTGRISSFLEERFPQMEIWGIDIAESMLELARQGARRTEYLQMSSSEAIAHFGEKRFDLVVAFRFFANAEPLLRKSVAADLVRLVAERGSIVLNNHRNFWSTSYIARRAAGQPAYGAINGDLERLFERHGFRRERRLSLGVWPQGDTHALMLPWKAVRAIEKANLAWPAAHHGLGYNTLLVFTRR